MSTVTFEGNSEEPGLNRNEVMRAALRCMHKAETMLDRANPRDEDDDSLALAVGFVTIGSHYLEVANAISRPATTFNPSNN